MGSTTEYAELHVHSAFSFLDGTATPEELVQAAAGAGLTALALTDHDGIYGAVRLHEEARRTGLKAIIGAEVTLVGGYALPLLAQTEEGYANLCRLLTRAHEDRDKTKAEASWDDLAQHARGLLALTGSPRSSPILRPLEQGDDRAARGALARLIDIYGPGQVHLELQRHLLPHEDALHARALDLARRDRRPIVATNGVRLARPEQKPLHDVLTSIRNHTTVARAGTLLIPNAEAHVKTAAQMARLFAHAPEAVHNAARIAERVTHSLDSLRYRFPAAPVPAGETPFSHLYALAQEGATRRYRPMSPAAARQIAHELDIIERLELAGYFLIVQDIVRFCVESGILCQGRGSAANSAVCYCLGITAVDPVRLDLLFERFLSEERSGTPDIDLDIEHERREEVIQYVYDRYGRDRAAMVNEVISYRGRSAIRDAGKALGLSLEQVGLLNKGLHGRGADDALDRSSPAVLDAASPQAERLRDLAGQIQGLPRHIGIHVGGMVVSHGKLIETVPVEPATMPGRTVIQWDKDDCERLGLVKIDLLGLGMLTMLRKAIDLVREHRDTEIDLAQLPHDDPAVYDRICAADTVGVFQIESRAQMNTLPRLRPRCFYDLVIEVALIRPGPIQGQMVHPYLRRRAGEEPVTYPHPSLKPILERTLGVPLFQEQGMKVAIVAAGFTPAQADRLRRAMGFRRQSPEMAALERDLDRGMRAKGLDEKARDQVMAQVTAFSNYGFPESHSASFALLVYASAWLKHYYPAEFACALLNSQPMGFYSPATIVNDARRHDVEVRPLDVTRSSWDCSIEDGALRIGLRYVRGMGTAHRARLEPIWEAGPFRSLEDFVLRTRLEPILLDRLAAAGAFMSFGLSRRSAQWKVKGLARPIPGPLGYQRSPEPAVHLREMAVAEELVADYATSGLSAGRQPLELLRARLDVRGVLSAAALAGVAAGLRVRVAGLVIVRQHPQTAKGFTFLTLEDETGFTNLILRPSLYERLRTVIHTASLVLATGRVQSEKGVVNVQCETLRALRADEVDDLRFESHDFH